MDYLELAKEFHDRMQSLFKRKPQKKITESMHGEMFTLQHLYQKGGSVLPNEISKEINVSTARTAAVLNSLENKGLIVRTVDTGDRRRILINLTDTGRETAQRFHNRHLDRISCMLQGLGERDAKELLRIMEKVIDNFSEIERAADYHSE